MSRWKKSKTPVNSKELTYEIILSKGYGKLTRKAEKMLEILGQHAIRKNNYTLQEDKEDCLQLSYLTIFTKWTSFNPDKTINAFAYFSEVHKRATAEMLNKIYFKKGISEKHQKYVKTLSINSTNNGNGLYNI